MDAVTFLKAIFAGCNGIPVTANAEDGFHSRRWTYGSEPPAGEAYYCISTVRDKLRARILHRRTDDLVETRAVVLDDIGTKIPFSTAAKFPGPSYKLETSPNNFHWGYFFKEGEDPARAAALIEALAAAGYTDKGTKRADRIMRIPGSLNTKFDPPFEARLIEWHPERAWTLSELAVDFDVVPSDTPALSNGPTTLEPGEVDKEFEWIKAHDMVLGDQNARGWYPIRCPKEHEHSGEIDHGTDYLPGKPGIFKCMHSHGDQLTSSWFRSWILEQDPGADLGLIERGQIAQLGNRLGAALGVLPTAPSGQQGDLKDGVPAGADLSRLQAALQAQAKAGSIFARPAGPAIDPSSLSPVQALALILDEVPLDPDMLPNCDTTAGGKVSRTQTTTGPRVHRVMDLIGMKARWNVLLSRVEASFELAPGFDSEADQTNAAEAMLIHACARCGMRGVSGIEDALLTRAMANPYSPVCDWIESVPWDGVSRLEELYATISMADKTEEAERWKRVAIRRWFLQGVTAMWNWKLGALAVDVGYVLILQGKTGLGKSKWIERVLPAPWVSIGKSLRLDGPNERDVVSRVTKTPVTEIGELDGTFAKSADAALKNFLTTTIDTYRPPFGRRDISKPRGTVFAASVNPEAFLKDPTGERRYWPLAVDKVDFPALEAMDRQQLWAEFKAMRDAGEQYWLDADEAVLHVKLADSHRIETDITRAIEDLRTRRAANPDQSKWEFYGTLDVAQHYMLKTGPSTTTDLSSLLVRAGFPKHRTTSKRGWLLPSLTAVLSPAQRAGFNVVLGNSAERLKKPPE
jgi:hypothetical protein